MNLKFSQYFTRMGRLLCWDFSYRPFREQKFDAKSVAVSQLVGPIFSSLRIALNRNSMKIPGGSILFDSKFNSIRKWCDWKETHSLGSPHWTHPIHVSFSNADWPILFFFSIFFLGWPFLFFRLELYTAFSVCKKHIVRLNIANRKFSIFGWPKVSKNGKNRWKTIKMLNQHENLLDFQTTAS